MSNREEYFRKFPLIDYRGTVGVNILKRVDFNSNVKGFYEAFYEYTMKEDDNIQHLAHDYYNDVDFDWLIYLANDIVDPYYGTPLNSTDFTSFIKKKYGSIEEAQKSILTYKTNYAAYIDNILALSAYQALPGNQKKYWQPIVSPTGVVGYSRSKEDLYVTTNRIISLSFTSEQSITFDDNENVYIKNNLDQTATVSSANSTGIILKNINGSFERLSNYTLVGKKSGVEVEIDFDSYILLQQCIPVDEEVYYSQYSYYSYEEDLNEKKRDLSLVENYYADDINLSLTEVLK
jgi:hypothetical protein